MWQLNNTSLFAASVALFPNEEAVDTLYVMVKATFNIDATLTLAEKQAKPFEADMYWDEPGESSVRYGSDMHVGKAATDIIVLGHACAPDKSEVREMEVSVSVGHVHKTIRVFGDRHWQDGKMSEPTPFKTMPLVYERAYGGIHRVDGKLDAAETRNPVGKGFVGGRKKEEMNGMPLPNLEDPNFLIRSLADKPTPACFGCSAPNWHPRAGFAGTYDGDWQMKRAPYLPKDFDKRFLNMAHADLVYPGFMVGGEAVRVVGMHASGAIQFNLPRIRLLVNIAVADKEKQPELALETLVVDTDAMTLSLVWRAAMLCDKKSFQLGEVGITRVS